MLILRCHPCFTQINQWWAGGKDRNESQVFQMGLKGGCDKHVEVWVLGEDMEREGRFEWVWEVFGEDGVSPVGPCFVQCVP